LTDVVAAVMAVVLVVLPNRRRLAWPKIFWIVESVPIRDTAPVDPRIRPDLPNGFFFFVADEELQEPPSRSRLICLPVSRQIAAAAEQQQHSTALLLLCRRRSAGGKESSTSQMTFDWAHSQQSHENTVCGNRPNQKKKKKTN
jgi:hypothetical protein